MVRTHRRGRGMGVDVANVASRGACVRQGAAHAQSRSAGAFRGRCHNVVCIARHAIPPHLQVPRQNASAAAERRQCRARRAMQHGLRNADPDTIRIGQRSCQHAILSCVQVGTGARYSQERCAHLLAQDGRFPQTLSLSLSARKVSSIILLSGCMQVQSIELAGRCLIAANLMHDACDILTLYEPGTRA